MRSKHKFVVYQAVKAHINARDEFNFQNKEKIQYLIHLLTYSMPSSQKTNTIAITAAKGNETKNCIDLNCNIGISTHEYNDHV